MKYLIIFVILLSGCDINEPIRPTTYQVSKYQQRCIDGVLYYTIGHGLAPAYNIDGNLKLCSKEKP